MLLILAPRRQISCECKAGMIYRVVSRTARTITEKLCFKKPKEKRKKASLKGAAVGLHCGRSLASHCFGSQSQPELFHCCRKETWLFRPDRHPRSDL